MFKLRFLFIIQVVSFSSITLFSQDQKRNLNPGDVYRLQTTSDAHISPDGQWIVYTITTIDSAKDKRNSDIWMTRWDGSESVQLSNSPDGESSPRWSPDGKYISFTSSRSGGSNQIFLLNRLGGDAKKLTDLQGELSEYSWSPDSKQILLTLKDPEDTAAQKKGKPYVIDRYQFKQDVEGYHYDNRKTHLYTFDLQNKKIDTLTKGKYNESSAQYSPDGKSSLCK